jgi:hypothetical protein
MPNDERYVERDPTYNPPNPDPDLAKEGTSLQEKLEVETEAVLEIADRGWSMSVTIPKWWKLSDFAERVAGFMLFLLILASGLTQLLWVRGMDAGAQILTYPAAFGGTALALWCLHTLVQRRVYGRRRSRAERKKAAREKVLKRWQAPSTSTTPPAPPK